MRIAPLAAVLALSLGMASSGVANAMPSGSWNISANRTLAALADVDRVATPVPGIVNAPSDASEGIAIGRAGSMFRVGLPGRDVNEGAIHENGTVTYEVDNGVSSAVIPTANGMQFLTVINNQAAPKSYDYPIELPEGGRIELVTSGPGAPTGSALGALLFDSGGQAVALVEAPWAIDSNGRVVKTYFTTDGSTLTQHVLHDTEGTAYPVVADPHFKWYKLGVVVTFTYDEMVMIAAGGVEAAKALIGASIPTGAGVLPAGAVSAALASLAAGAAWGVATRSCFWFWAPYPGVWDTPDQGYYDC